MGRLLFPSSLCPWPVCCLISSTECFLENIWVVYRTWISSSHSLSLTLSGSSKVIALTSKCSLCIHFGPAFVCVYVCVLCVYSMSFLASPNNSPTVINIVWRSLWPAVSGPAARGFGSDADEWPHTHKHTKFSVAPHSQKKSSLNGVCASFIGELSW